MEKSVLEKHKVLVVGGHPKWLPKLSRRCPHFIYKDLIRTSDTKLVAGVDIVCVDIKNACHKSYDNVQALAQKYKVPLVYFRGTNLENNLQILADACAKRLVIR